MIESSFLKQYGIRLSVDELEYTEFNRLLSCIMNDTPLGQIVAIRSESNPEVLRTFTKEQRRIRDDWIKRSSQEKRKQEYTESMDKLFRMALA